MGTNICNGLFYIVPYVMDELYNPVRNSSIGRFIFSNIVHINHHTQGKSMASTVKFY